MELQPSTMEPSQWNPVMAPKAPPYSSRYSWEKAILSKSRKSCGNCGGKDKLAVRMVVPDNAGGQWVESNGVVLCRACDIATDLAARKAPDPQDRRPVNFWVSRALYDNLKVGVEGSRALASVSELVRYLMAKYSAEPDRFDDLDLYQDGGGADVKVNVWVEAELYGAFKEAVLGEGKTVTDALKSLIKMWGEGEELFGTTSEEGAVQ